MAWRTFRFGAVIALALFSGTQLVLGLVWPTPNKAFQEGLGVDAFIQPTASGAVESGMFGCVRNDGNRFHEAIDLFPIERDANGEALDPIFSILPGRVVHINEDASRSSYGRYIVIQHTDETLAFHSLYSHLSRVSKGLKVGMQVKEGAVLGIMGRSASGYSIPKSRAHLHFEIGLALSESFQDWYASKAFKTKNYQGRWNGMNLVSVDPLAFYSRIQAGEVSDFSEFLKKVPTAAILRIYSDAVPDFVQRYPLLANPISERKKLVAWDVAFTDFGVPKQWMPRYEGEIPNRSLGEVVILKYNAERLRAQSCERVVDLVGNKPKLSRSTLSTLQKLFKYQ